MANMGYCRFQNTLSDFIDCIRNHDNIQSGDEKRAARALYEQAQEYIDIFEELEENEEENDYDDENDEDDEY